MSQHDFDIANATASVARADINTALKALGSLNSGATAPATTYANMIWYDTTANILKMRSEANDAWINIGTLDQSLNTFTPAGVATQTTATWEAGTDTTESLVSAAKIAAAIAAQVVPVDVATETAALEAGAVGSYCWVRQSSAQSIDLVFNATWAGSSLRANGYYSATSLGNTVQYAGVNGGALAGTWRIMGDARHTSASTMDQTLALRIA